MKYPPKGPIRPDVIRPIAVNPVGNRKNHFGFSGLPGRPRQVVWSKELGRGAYCTPLNMRVSAFRQKKSSASTKGKQKTGSPVHQGSQW